MIGERVSTILARRKRLDWKIATTLVREAARALEAWGRPHGCVDPAHLTLTPTGELTLLGEPGAELPREFGLVRNGQLSAWSAHYFSPEQGRSEPIDVRTDVYALGIVYSYLLTGVKPVNGKNVQEIVLKHLFEEPGSPKVHVPDVPDAVCAVIARCLKKAKNDRYATTAELARALERVCAEPASALLRGLAERDEQH